MTGTLINAVAVVAGFCFGYFTKKFLSARLELFLRGLIAACLFFFGFKLLVGVFGSGFLNGLKVTGVALISIMIGAALGRALNLQAISNRCGRFASDSIKRGDVGNKVSFGDGFVAVSILLCLNPLSIFGALQEGVSGNWQILGIKGVIDGLAVISFARSLGVATLVSVLPLISFQGFLTLLGKWAVTGNFFKTSFPIDTFDAASGFLCFVVCLPILNLKRVELANYVPSLIIAPILAQLLF